MTERPKLGGALVVLESARTQVRLREMEGSGQEIVRVLLESNFLKARHAMANGHTASWRLFGDRYAELVVLQSFFPPRYQLNLAENLI